MAKCGIRKEKFSLHHTNVDRFHSSHWSSTGTTTGLYVIYRWVLAILMVAGIIAHIIDFSEKNPAWKWLIYMTNQGISLLTVHYIIYATITLLNYLLPRGFEYNATLPFLYKFSWALQNMSSSAALFITIIYWSILHPIVVAEGMMSGPWKEFLNVFLHLLNTLSYLLDIFITARPTRIHHFYFAIIFGIWYMLFSLIYWAAGGTGFCYWDPVSNSTTAAVTSSTVSSAIASATESTISTTSIVSSTTATLLENWKCDTFIYPILDWGGHPGLAIGMIIGGVFMMPILQTIWWCCYKLRCFISDKCC